jgi:hypothetical protein
MSTVSRITFLAVSRITFLAVRADDYYGGQFGGMSSGFSGMGAGLGGGHMMGGGYSGFKRRRWQVWFSF